VTWLVAGMPVRSLLLTRLRYLGDVAMSTVLCEALRAGDPELRLGYLCEQAHGEILADHPFLDRVHLLGVQRSGQDERTRAPNQASGSQITGRVLGTWPMIRELRRTRYDVAVDLFFNPRSAWLLWLSGIGIRIGGTRKWRRRLYTHTVLRDEISAAVPDLSAVAPGGLGEHLCRLAPLVHAESGQDFLGWVCDRFAPGELKPRLAAAAVAPTASEFLVLAPGATWPTKQWPAAHWRQLITALVAGDGPCLRILVPPGRAAEWGGLADGLPGHRIEVLPPMGLAAVKDLLAAARGLLSVDGGVMHMGVALGIPTLALFGPTDPGIWFPYQNMGPFRVLARAPHCHPCDLHQCDNFICLPELTVAAVLAVVEQMFGPFSAPDGAGAS